MSNLDKKNITIYDIAKKASVSPTTVSRVLRDNPLVKESTMQRVLTIMKELNFIPNEAARSLTKQQTNMIGFILPDITNPFFSQVYMEVEKKAQEKGFTVLLRNSVNKSEMEAMHLRELSERRVQCIVFMGGRINHTNPEPNEINEVNEVLKKVPIIMVNGEMKGVDCHKVRTNEEEGIRSIVSYLVSLGHKQISLIGGRKGISSTDIKVSCLKRTLKKYNIPYNPDWQIYSGFGVEDGKIAMRQLLQKESLPTAIIGINDMVTFGALKECREKKISINQFSFVGFDDIFPSDIVHPSLTTVSHNYDVLSSEIVKSIENIISGKTSKKGKLVETKLIVRESCRKVNDLFICNGSNNNIIPQ